MRWIIVFFCICSFISYGENDVWSISYDCEWPQGGLPPTRTSMEAWHKKVCNEFRAHNATLDNNLMQVIVHYRKADGDWAARPIRASFISGFSHKGDRASMCTLGDALDIPTYGAIGPFPTAATPLVGSYEYVRRISDYFALQQVHIQPNKLFSAQTYAHSEQAFMASIVNTVGLSVTSRERCLRGLTATGKVHGNVRPTMVILSVVSTHSACPVCRRLFTLVNKLPLKNSFLRALFDENVTYDNVPIHVVYSASDILPKDVSFPYNASLIPGYPSFWFIHARR